MCWPLLLYHFHVRPWELDNFTPAQLQELCAQARKLNEGKDGR